MNTSPHLLILFCINLISFGCLADNKQAASSERHQQTPNKEKKNIKKISSSKIKPFSKIKYIPPFLGVPSTDRLNGMGTRHPEKQIDLLFSVLAPAHIALTSLPQPDLYWFSSEIIPKSFHFIEFVLNSEESISPIYRTRLPQPEKVGMHRLKIADHNITLKPEIEYSWSIALVKNPQERSKDYVSSGRIKYAKPDKKIQQRLKKSLAKQQASIYAQASYWYEAVSIAFQHQKEHPYFLPQLTNQVELKKIAEYIDKEGKYKTHIQTPYSMQLPVIADN